MATKKKSTTTKRKTTAKKGTNALKKITADAKKIKSKHPGMKWQNCVKQASKSYKKSK